MNQDVPLADFAHGPRKGGASPSSRVVAAVLTAGIYALLFLVALIPPPRAPEITLSETTALLLPDPPAKTDRPAPPLLPMLLIRPHVESVAPPDFTVATLTPPSPVPLPAIAPLSTPLLGGIPSGAGASAGSANGSMGTGDAASGCFDAAWARAVRDQIGHYYHYPRGARGARGIVMMQFTVHRSGRVEMLKVGTSSGNKWLDREAYDMVREAEPLPQVPERMHARRVKAQMPINFGVEGAIFSPTPDSCE
jgi:protein TonB